jgi:tetratricopeptide (TPR) repeat protein
MSRVARIVFLSAALSVPLAMQACGGDDATKPGAKTPAGKQTAAGPNAAPGPGGQYGMSDSPSGLRPGELPDGGGYAMNGQAAGYYQQGLQAFASGNLVQAKASFGQATQADPKAYQAYYSLGVVQERLRDANAPASYRQALSIRADYEPAIIAYAMYQAKRNNLGDADRFLTEKRGQMPKSAAVLATLAEVKSLQKDTGSAQRIAGEALKINPDYRPAMVIIARDHYRNRRLDLALYALQAILDGFGPENPPRDKDNAEARLLRALIWREQGQRAQAIEEFRKAVAKRPDLVEARVGLATFLLEAGNADEAQPLLEGALRYDSENVPSHLNLGDTYRLLGRYPDAKKEFEWVLARDPSLPQVHYDLGLLYLFAPSIPGMTAKQQVTEAQRELKKYQEIRKKGEVDDSDELLNRAKLKEGELQAASKAAQPTPPASGGAKPAPGGADAGAKDAAGGAKTGG